MAEADAQYTKNNLFGTDSNHKGAVVFCDNCFFLNGIFLNRLASIAENDVHAKHNYILFCQGIFPFLLFLSCYARASWVLWSMHVRSWQRTKRAVPQGSHSRLLSSFTPTWLTWMGTSHRMTWTSSSAACRKECRCQSCVTNKETSFYRKQTWWKWKRFCIL